MKNNLTLSLLNGRGKTKKTMEYYIGDRVINVNDGVEYIVEKVFENILVVRNPLEDKAPYPKGMLYPTYILSSKNVIPNI